MSMVDADMLPGKCRPVFDRRIWFSEKDTSLVCRHATGTVCTGCMRRNGWKHEICGHVAGRKVFWGSGMLRSHSRKGTFLWEWRMDWLPCMHGLRHTGKAFLSACSGRRGEKGGDEGKCSDTLLIYYIITAYCIMFAPQKLFKSFWGVVVCQKHKGKRRKSSSVFVV